MANDVKNKIPRVFLPIDLNFHNDIKFREASFMAKKDGKDIPAFYFIHTFEFYCLAAKKERKNIDIRFISLYGLISTTGWTEEFIKDINNYLVKTKLLTKRYTITSYYKWNNSDSDILISEISEQNLTNSEILSVKLSNTQITSEANLRKKISDRKSHLRKRLKLTDELIKQDSRLVSLEQELLKLTSENTKLDIILETPQITSEPNSENSASSETPLRPPLYFKTERQVRQKEKEKRNIEKEKIIQNFDETKFKEIISQIDKTEFSQHQNLETLLKKVYLALLETNFKIPDYINLSLFILAIAKAHKNLKKSLTASAFEQDLKALAILHNNNFNIEQCLIKWNIEPWRAIRPEYFYYGDKPKTAFLLLTNVNSISSFSYDNTNKRQFETKPQQYRTTFADAVREVANNR
jgi:hypothetical protein